MRLHALLAALALTLVLAGCQRAPSVEDDLGGAAYPLVDTDSAAVAFPDAYAGDVLVVSYIYTRCPDVCPLITANMKAVYDELGSTEGVRFVSISFDPARDTPSVLADYRRVYRLTDARWSFLTGAPATVDSLMARMNVRTALSADTDSTDLARGTYFLDHTDQVTLIDPQGRVRAHYGASRTPPAILVEDINALRAEAS